MNESLFKCVGTRAVLAVAVTRFGDIIIGPTTKSQRHKKQRYNNTSALMSSPLVLLCRLVTLACAARVDGLN